eukprot:scaffold12635_cov111-Isochrysis_galbana.AAC.2
MAAVLLERLLSDAHARYVWADTGQVHEKCSCYCYCDVAVFPCGPNASPPPVPCSFPPRASVCTVHNVVRRGARAFVHDTAAVARHA